MKVLVTGANGLLGVNLVRELVRTGEKVIAFVRPSANLNGLMGVPCEIIRGDILCYNDVVRAVSQSDRIIHAASTTSVMPREFEYYKKINVSATENIVRAVLNSRNQRLVYVSTAQAFSPGSKANPADERSPFTLFEYKSGYINSKYLAQQYVLENVNVHNLNAVVVNPTYMIGPYDAKPSSGKIIVYGLKRGIQWCPSGGKNFVHVRYVAQGIYRALQFGRKGECYLLTGENLTYKEFFSLLNQVSGRKRLQLTLPKPLVHAAGTVKEAWGKLNDYDVAFNKKNAELLCLDNYYSGEKAKREFKLELMSIKNAIGEALTWFKKENYVSEDNYSIHGTNLDL